MGRIVLFHVVLATLLAATPLSAQKPDSAEMQLQAATRKETMEGDLKGTIAMYERLIANAKGNRAVTARALLRLGKAYEKLGSVEARKAYERVVKEFNDQPDASEARAFLLAAGDAADGETTDRILYSASGAYGGRNSRNGRYVAFECDGAICIIETATSSIRTVAPKPKA